MKKFALAAAAALYASPASATLILPGTPAPGLAPTPAAGDPGILLAFLQVPATATTFSATLYSAVYEEATGDLDFLYQVARTGPGSAQSGNDQAIQYLTASAFDHFTVDALVDVSGGGFFPFLPVTNLARTALISRSISGNTLTLTFEPDLVGMDVSPVYIFRTDATSFTLGAYGIIDDSTIHGMAFAPMAAGAVPEPGTWMMMLAGIGLIGGLLRFRRRRKPRPSTA